jgi:hypothetical protein
MEASAMSATSRDMSRRVMLQSVSGALLAAPMMARSAQEGSGSSGGGGGAASGSGAVFELRIYHAAAGKLGELLARFREHTDKLFARHNMKSVAYWTPVEEPGKSATLIYVLKHPSQEAATANWKAFQDDPEWKAVKATSEEKGSLVEKVDSTYMELTDFSKRV